MTATVRKLEVYQEPRPSQQPKKGKYVVNPVLLASFFVLTVAIALVRSPCMTIVDWATRWKDQRLGPGRVSESASAGRAPRVGSLEYVEGWRD